MAVRATMVDLIRLVRDEVGDELPYQFDDQRVQNWLDNYQSVYRYQILIAAPDIGPNGIVSFANYYAPDDVHWWESDALLIDRSWNIVEPMTSDWLTGHWVFDLTTLPDLSGQTPPVYIIGKTYDVMGAAADYLTAWASREARRYDFSDKQVSYKRSQVAGALRAQAAEYRARMRPQVAQVTRSDVGQKSGINAFDWWFAANGQTR